MKAHVELDLGTAAQAVHDALVPEAQDGPQGSTTELRLDGQVLTLDIEADDLSTLRAAIHIVRLVDAAQRSASPS